MPISCSNILIIRLSALGDVIHALPALDALRRGFPRARISWAVEEASAGLLSGCPQIDEVIVVPRKGWSKGARSPRRWPAILREIGGCFRSLRSKRFDLAIDLQGNARSAILARGSGAGRLLGFPAGHTKEGSHWAGGMRPPIPEGRLHRAERNLALVGALGIPTDGSRAVVRLPEPLAASVRGKLADALGPGVPYAVVHPGVSRFGDLKRWEPSAFAEVCRRLAAVAGLRSVVTWGPGEEELARAVAGRSEGAAVVGPATASVLELAAVMAGARVAIACDTGPLHLAPLFGVPAVGLYGPKDPEIYGPWPDRSHVVFRGIWCSPCTLRRCFHRSCMQLIRPEDVVAEALRALEP